MSDRFFAEFDAMFAELARRARPGAFEPNADISIAGDGVTLVVDVELAGADPAGLRVVVQERRLHITGRRIDRERAARGSLLMKEIEYGEFSKTVLLPVAVEYDAAVASYRDGILSIRLPISEDALLPSNRTEIRMTVRRILA